MLLKLSNQTERVNDMKKICALFCLCILLSVSPAYAADPFDVHKGGFGPTIKGLQLGMPSTTAMPEGLKWGSYNEVWLGNADISIEFREGRISEFVLKKSAFQAEFMSHREFAQALVDAYDLPELEWMQEGDMDCYFGKNLTEGWGVAVFTRAIAVSTVTIPGGFD